MTKQLLELGQWKVGTKVCIFSDKGMGGERLSIRVIEKITDGWGGTVFVNGTKFDKDGMERTNSYRSDKIVIATDEHSLNIKGYNARHRLKNFKWDELSNPRVIEIEELLNDHGIDLRREHG